MIEYGDEDLLMLSGIQHITFCKRQWALIHIEQQWAENNLTIEGNWMHQKVDDPTLMNRNKGIVTLRSVTLVSRRATLQAWKYPGPGSTVEVNVTSAVCSARSLPPPDKIQ